METKTIKYLKFGDNAPEKYEIDAAKLGGRTYEELAAGLIINPAGTDFGLVKSGGDVTINNGIITVNGANIEENDTVAYTKPVPDNALPYAEVLEIGGMTRKCTNLIPYPYSDNSKTEYGVTWTVLDDGRVHAVGTATRETYFNLTKGIVWASTSVTQWTARTVDGKTFGADLIFDNGNNILYVSIPAGSTVDKIFTPMINYGEEALPFEPYFAGVRSAPVTAVESAGANLIIPSAVSRTVDGVTFVVNADGSIDVHGTATANHYYGVGSVNVAAGTYTLSGSLEGGSSNTFVLYLQGVGVSSGGDSGNNKVVTISAALSCDVLFLIRTGTTVDGTLRPMLNKGATALPYSPYFESTLEIPQAVQRLDGYGEGISETCYNYVDWEKKQCVKYVGVVDMGTIQWSETNFPNTFRSGVQNLKSPDTAIERKAGIIISKYPPSSNVDYTNIDDKSAIRYQTNILVRDSDYSDAATFKAAMSGVMLVYELAEPVITDISDILGANSIPVEEGGTVTFINEYNYDVPNKINFYTSENIQEAIGAKKIVGELIGNASSADTAKVADRANKADSIATTALDLSAGKTVANIRTQLAAWVAKNYGKTGVACTFLSDLPSLATNWNAENITATIAGGATNTVYLDSYYRETGYAQLRITSYYNKRVYYTALTNGTWQPLRQVAFDNDLPKTTDDIEGGTQTWIFNCGTSTTVL